MDEMKPIERMKAFAKGEEIDRIPINLSLGETATTLYGLSIYEYSHSPKAMADVEVYNFRKFKTDGCSISVSLRGVAEAMGSTVNYEGKNIPYVEEYFVKTIDDIEKLEIINPLKDGRLPVVFEALDNTIDEIGNEVGVSLGLSGPISVAANLCGAENLLRWSMKKPDKIGKMLDIITESNNVIIDEVAKRQISISFADPVASTSLLRKKQFDTIALPYIKRNIHHSIKKLNRKPSIHVCGKSKELWDDLVEAGISGFSIDNIEDIQEAKEVMGDRVVIIGNVPPVEVISKGSREIIYESVRECIRKGHDSRKGYIIAPGCQIPLRTSSENIQMYVDAGKKYGTYPLDIDRLNK